ncbi:MAG: MarR family transcriptional regulator [Myxococcota bacterium]
MSSSPFLHASLAFRIHRLQRLLRRQFLRKAEEAGMAMTPEQFFLLRKLVERDGQSQTELADDALQDRPNLTRMLRELDARGLIARREDPDDARRRLVHLTRAGQDLHDAFVARVVEPTRDSLFAGLDPGDVATVHAVFDALEARI